jgi:hypothetical protein
MFAGISAKEAAGGHTLIAESKVDAAAVLRANGWRETSPESAQFRLSMVRVERHGRRTTTQPDPRNDRRPPQKCERGYINVKKPCYEDPAPNYPPIRTTNVYTIVSVGYSIERVSDGATAWWVTSQEPLETRQFVARKTLELLLAVEKHSK